MRVLANRLSVHSWHLIATNVRIRLQRAEHVRRHLSESIRIYAASLDYRACICEPASCARRCRWIDGDLHADAAPKRAAWTVNTRFDGSLRTWARHTHQRAVAAEFHGAADDLTNRCTGRPRRIATPGSDRLHLGNQLA